MADQPEDNSLKKWSPAELAKIIEMEQQQFERTPVEHARQRFTESVSFAVESIIWLAMYSESEPMRFNAARYVAESVFGKPATTVSSVSDNPEEQFRKVMEGIVVADN